MNIRVAIIEDDPDIRRLLSLIVDHSPGYMCDRSFESCEDALENLIEDEPHVLLMDIDLPGMNGIEGVKALRKAGYKSVVLMLTIHEGHQRVFESLCAGANGYLNKGLPPVQLLEHIAEAHAGGAPMSAKIAAMVVKSFHRPTNNPLSEREQEILSLLCEGENYATIATELFISKNTVKGHIKNIYKKLHVHSRAEAVSKAIQSGYHIP